MTYDTKPWLKSYDPGAEAEIEIPDVSLKDYFLDSFRQFSDSVISVGVISVGPSYMFVLYEKICQKWSFFSLREHFSGAKTSMGNMPYIAR